MPGKPPTTKTRYTPTRLRDAHSSSVGIRTFHAVVMGRPPRYCRAGAAPRPPAPPAPAAPRGAGGPRRGVRGGPQGAPRGPGEGRQRGTQHGEPGDPGPDEATQPDGRGQGVGGVGGRSVVRDDGWVGEAGLEGG